MRALCSSVNDGGADTTAADVARGDSSSGGAPTDADWNATGGTGGGTGGADRAWKGGAGSDRAWKAGWRFACAAALFRAMRARCSSVKDDGGGGSKAA